MRRFWLAFFGGVVVGVVGSAIALLVLTQSVRDRTEELVREAEESYLQAKAQRESSEAVLREADELIALNEFHFGPRTLALRALREGYTACAVCMLDRELLNESTRLDKFFETATQSGREFSEGTVRTGRKYFADYPYDDATCREACLGVLERL